MASVMQSRLALPDVTSLDVQQQTVYQSILQCVGEQ